MFPLETYVYIYICLSSFPAGVVGTPVWNLRKFVELVIFCYGFHITRWCFMDFTGIQWTFHINWICWAGSVHFWPEFDQGIQHHLGESFLLGTFSKCHLLCKFKGFRKKFTSTKTPPPLFGDNAGSTRGFRVTKNISSLRIFTKGHNYLLFTFIVHCGPMLYAEPNPFDPNL